MRKNLERLFPEERTETHFMKSLERLVHEKGLRSAHTVLKVEKTCLVA